MRQRADELSVAAGKLIGRPVVVTGRIDTPLTAEARRRLHRQGYREYRVQNADLFCNEAVERNRTRSSVDCVFHEQPDRITAKAGAASAPDRESRGSPGTYGVDDSASGSGATAASESRGDLEPR